MPEKNWTADHVAGVLPEVLESLVSWNEGTQTSYGADDATEEARLLLCDLFETEVDVLFVTTGTGSNALALACLTPAYGSILCAAGAHIQTSECGAPELYSGAKLTLVPGPADGRMDIGALADLLSAPHKKPHAVLPSTISITQPTESGKCYSVDELEQMCSLAETHQLRVHMDGARFANALAAMPDVTPAQMTWKAGVDVLSFGTTKNGTMCCEAVVCFRGRYRKEGLFTEAEYRRKRGGLLLEKMRFLSAQLLGYLNGGAWLRAAAQANMAASRLALQLKALPGVTIVQPVEVNMVFLEMPKDMLARLSGGGYQLSLTAGSMEAKGTPSSEEHVRLRLGTFWSMTEDDVDAFVACAGGQSG